MMPEPVLLKLGGSVITDKRGECAVNEKVLDAHAATLASAGFSGLLVHGAGSCGHPEARRYGLAQGADRSSREGIVVTHEAVASLNRAVVASLRKAGVDAVGLHPLSSCTTENGRIDTFAIEPLRLLMDLGCVPVLHGDVVLDRTRGACIVSGDQLISYLAPRIGLYRIGLATDVPGVLAEGRVVPRITRANFGDLEIGLSSNADVTGGMRGKVLELLELADTGASSHIFASKRLEDFLALRPHGGTEIAREEDA
jgi:isopentenyl phosphate kinase